MKKSHLLGAVCACATAFVLSTSANASTLVFNASGEITGVNGIQSDGTYWDASFVDGTCATIDANCTTEGYQAASNNLYGRLEDHLSALLSFAYGRNDFAAYDSDGNDDTFVLYVISNYVGYPAPTVRAMSIGSGGPSIHDPVGNFGTLQDIDPSANQDNVFASAGYQGAFVTFQVSAVPVPAAAWLFGSGLLGLVGMARRKKA